MATAGCLPNSTFSTLDRNKRSLAVDLKSEAWRAIFTRLAHGGRVAASGSRTPAPPTWATARHRGAWDGKIIRRCEPGIRQADVGRMPQKCFAGVRVRSQQRPSPAV